MAPIFHFITLALALTGLAGAKATPIKQDGATLVKRECSSIRTAMPWDHFTDNEKSTYLDAVVCLTTADKITDNELAENLWDEIQYNHIWQTNYIHFVGQFLPWHRYFVYIYRTLLESKCGYIGPLPYWNEISDAETLTNIADASVFQSDAFGGDGLSTLNCISNGPFANVTLHWTGNGTTGNNCISRVLNLARLQWASQSYLDACFAYSTFAEASDCYGQQPHAAGHSGTSGIMSDTSRSPGDPIFFLHHAWLDAMWWQWQEADLDTRLTDIGGSNTVSQQILDDSGWEAASPRLTDYSGDPGNTTTLNHTLYMTGLADNVTIGDVMDIRAYPLCMMYIYNTTQG